MLWPCEGFVKNFLPLVRACVARRLIEDYSFSQQEAARRLDLTQAAVSKALSQYKQKIKKMEADARVSKLVSQLADEIACGGLNAAKSRERICESCEYLLGSQCGRSEKTGPKSQEVAGYV